MAGATVGGMMSLLAGVLAGLIHVFAGPDHLAAIAPLAINHRRGAWRAGVRWGVGHSGGVLVVAAIALAVRGWLVADRLSGWGERWVGAALIGIGLWALRRAFAGRLHTHRHSHAAFGMGLLHGVAGGSHIIGILPALALPTVMASAGYVGGFAAGTVAAMGVFAATMGWLSGSMAQRGLRASRWVLGASGAAAMAVGAFWIIHGPA